MCDTAAILHSQHIAIFIYAFFFFNNQLGTQFDASPCKSSNTEQLCTVLFFKYIFIFKENQKYTF
jgi:hypothetical protein